MEVNGQTGSEDGLIGRIVGSVRKVLGKRGYEEVARDDEDRRISAERRAKETPSAIYAHKSVAVSREVFPR